MPPRGISASFEGRPVTQAVADRPRIARCISTSIGMTGNTTQFLVTRKVCIKLMCGTGMNSVLVNFPLASITS